MKTGLILATAALSAAACLYFLFFHNRFDRPDDSRWHYIPDPSRLIGTWRIAEERTLKYLQGKPQLKRFVYPVASAGDYFWTWRFTADGRCEDISYKNGAVLGRYLYRWSIEGNRLIMREKESDDEMDGGLIMELNDSLLVLNNDDTDATGPKGRMRALERME